MKRRVVMLGNADIDEIGRSVCSVLNGDGGEVHVLVDDDHAREMESELHAYLYPTAYVVLEKDLDTLMDWRFKVPSGNDKPYAYKDIVYVMKGDAAVQASAEHVRAMVLNGQTMPERWEIRTSLMDYEDCLDESEIEAAGRDIREHGRVGIAGCKDTESFLRAIAVVRFGFLTNAGDLLFAKDCSVRSPQTRIRAFCFLHDKADEEFIDSQLIDTVACKAIEQALSFIRRNVRDRTLFHPEALKNVAVRDYPEMALREALVNAVVHRDYESVSGGVYVYIFPTRLEIWNSGELPENIKVSSLGTEQISVLRNPSLAYVLYARGLMEQSGRGNILIVRECIAAGLPRPVWKSDANGVRIIFSLVEDINGEQLNGKLKDRITAIISANGGINAKKILERLSCSASSLNRYLSYLIKKKIIERRGGKKFGGYYRIR